MNNDENQNPALSPGFQKESTTLDPSPSDASLDAVAPKEVGGRNGLDPTRYGDWEKNGRCIDF